MEATAVSLTRTVLDGVLGNVGTAMADEAALLLGVPREVEFIRSELQMMQSFLRVQSSAACSTGGCCKDMVRTCVKQVRDLACDLEDCLLDFTMHDSSRASWLRWVPGLAASHRVADRIRDLKASLVELNQRNKRYNVFVAAHAQPVTAEEHWHADGVYQLTPRDEQEDIQRNKEMDDLAKLVNKEDARVVSVWGMGGMGKSSLVRILYNDTDFIAKLDGRAWVTVPHPLDSTDELERRLRKQLGVVPDPERGIPAWLEENRCLVVVDDVSSHEEWELISRCVGVGGANGTGIKSRVVVTTRLEDVAQQCARDESHVFELKPLGDDEALKLLCQKRTRTASFRW